MKTFDAMPFREWVGKLYSSLTQILKLESFDVIEDGALKKAQLVGDGFVVFVLSGGADQSIEVVIEDKEKATSWNLSRTVKLEGVLQWMIDNRAESNSPEHLLAWTIGYFDNGLRRRSEFARFYK